MKTIGLIGVGHMGYALYSRMKKEARFVLYNRTFERIAELEDENTKITRDIEDLLDCDYIMVGVQPGDFGSLFNDISEYLEKDRSIHWVSMAAALSLDQLYKLVPEGHTWLRIMPNTPVEIGEGYVSYTSKDRAYKEYQDFIDVLETCGYVQEFDEKSLDIASTVAGCSPAYIYMMIEAMADGAVQHGLSRSDAYDMVTSVLIGSAQMVRSTGKHPGELKDQVTSPGGTTIAGVAELEKAGLRQSLIRAIDASIRRGEQLHKEN